MVHGSLTVLRRGATWPSVARGAARRALALLKARMKTQAFATFVLSGGRSGAAFLRALAALPETRRFPWSRVHVFWADERHVPQTHPESLFGMTQRLWAKRVPLPKENQHPFFGRPGNLYTDARRFDRFLKGWLKRNKFDVVLLGLGEDGHTASLFPGQKAVGGRWVIPVPRAPKSPARRLSLSWLALNRSHHVLFLLSGQEKRGAFEKCRERDRPLLPAARVRPRGGTVEWWVDRSVLAEGEITPRPGARFR